MTKTATVEIENEQAECPFCEYVNHLSKFRVSDECNHYAGTACNSGLYFAIFEKEEDE